MPAGMSGAYNKLWWTSFICSPCWGWWWLMSKGATSQNRWLGFFPFSLSSPSHSRCIIIIMVMMVIFFILHRCMILLSDHIVITGNFCETFKCSGLELLWVFRLGNQGPNWELGDTGREFSLQVIHKPSTTTIKWQDYNMTIWEDDKMTKVAKNCQMLAKICQKISKGCQHFYNVALSFQ